MFRIDNLFLAWIQKYQWLPLKIIDVITSRFFLIFPKIFGLHFRKIYNLTVKNSLACLHPDHVVLGNLLPGNAGVNFFVFCRRQSSEQSLSWCDSWVLTSPGKADTSFCATAFNVQIVWLTTPVPTPRLKSRNVVVTYANILSFFKHAKDVVVYVKRHEWKPT